MAVLAPDSPVTLFLARKRTTFTWLIPLGLLIAAYFVGVWSVMQYSLGFALLTLGEVVRFWAAGCIHKDNVVATTGPYAYVRNPLYFGSFLLAVGYALTAGLGIVGVLVMIVLYLIFHMSAILTEEVSLTKAFGEPYDEYRRHVPRLFPRPTPYKSENAVKMTFSWEQVKYNREPTTALVTFVTALVFAGMQYYHYLHPQIVK